MNFLYIDNNCGAPYFLYAAKHVLKVIEDVWSVDRKPPCFLYTAKRVLKVIEDVWSVDRESTYFLYVAKRVLKVIEDVWSIDREPLAISTRCYACKKHKFLQSKGSPIRTPLLFVCGARNVKRLSFC
jgi:hypothetical protein